MSHVRPTRSRFPSPPGRGRGGIVVRLIVANVAIWLLFLIATDAGRSDWFAWLYYDVLSLEPHAVLPGFELWQVVSYMFLHDLQAGSHVVFNMVALFFLGRPLEQMWGSRDLLRFYLLAGIGAGVFVVLCGLLLPGLFGARVVGASGAVMALLVALGRLRPDMTLLLFFVIPVRLGRAIWLVLALDTVLFLFTDSDVAWHGHVGGAIAAWLLLTGSWRPGVLRDRLRLWRLARNRSRLRVVRDEPPGRSHLH